MKATQTGELERRQAARQVEPGGMEELWWEGSNYINIKIFISNIFAFSGREGRFTVRAENGRIRSFEC